MSETVTQGKVLGILAELDSAGALLRAAAQLRSAGYREFDCHSPFPIHGMDDAMGESRSRVSYIAGLGSLFGGLFIVWLTWWVSSKAYPMIISGKPFFSYQAYVPVIFAICVLLAAFGALFGFMAVTKIRFHHPLFYSENFAKFSDDGFFVSIEAGDPQFDVTKSSSFLEQIGGRNIEVLEEK